MNQSIENAVKKKILNHGRGWCFTPKHFLDINSPTGVRSALIRLENDKIIRRLTHGLYEYPRLHNDLGELPPQIEKIVKALSEKNGVRVQPSGAYAANLVGLSEQVPGRILFLTNGPSRTIRIGKLEIAFKTATEKTLYASGKVGLVIQALKNIGKNHIDAIAKKRVQRFLKGTTKSEVIKNLKHAPQWVRSQIMEIMGL